MELSHYNFGINGQPAADWDNFICLGRKCKARKAERHKVRMEKKKLKNDQQRAGTEALRAETSLTKQISAAAPVSVNTLSQTTLPVSSRGGLAQVVPRRSANPNDSSGNMSTGRTPIQKAGGNKQVFLVVGLVVAGGLAYQLMKRKGSN